MKKEITFKYKGNRADVGDFKVMRLLPNRYVRTVGPFFFLDHMLPNTHSAKKAEGPDGSFAHPHRGIITFTYLLDGEIEHYDSRGHHGVVGAGGAQWMNSGNGIIHDENPSVAFQERGGTLHGLQFWILLPAKNKAEAPDYMAVHAADVPEIDLDNGAGKLRVLIGEYEQSVSKVKTFTQQFLYHVRLNAGTSFSLSTVNNFQYATFPVNGSVSVNNEPQENDILVFGLEGEGISLSNTGNEPADIMLFGGEPYTEPVYAEGPFVMNTMAEIGDAYRDFYAGKYGTIKYESLVKS